MSDELDHAELLETEDITMYAFANGDRELHVMTDRMKREHPLSILCWCHPMFTDQMWFHHDVKAP